jgi:hypothetical protein
MVRLQEQVEEIKAAYPIEKGKVSFVIVTNNCEYIGEFARQLVPFNLAGYTYVAWSGSYVCVLASEDVGITFDDYRRFISKPPASYVTTEDGIDGIVYYAELVD